MKKPMLLFLSVFISIIILSILFPQNPSKKDILSIIQSKKQQNIIIPDNTEKKYSIVKISKIEDMGRALIWSNDEKKLFYVKSLEKNNNLDSYNKIEELWYYNIDGNKNKINVNEKLYNISNTKISPDGNYLSFTSTYNNFSILYIYDINNEQLSKISTEKSYDTGITSYDWNKDSKNIIMSIDITDPHIEIYNILTKKFKRLDIDLRECRNVAYYINNSILFSDNLDGQYKIYSADEAGQNINFLTLGADFIVSKEKYKIAILSNEYNQKGLWIYNNRLNNVKTLLLEPVYIVQWLEGGALLYSTEEDCYSNYSYKGSIMSVSKELEVIEVTGSINSIFVSMLQGNKIAMTCPNFVKDVDEGIYLGELYR